MPWRGVYLVMHPERSGAQTYSNYGGITVLKHAWLQRSRQERLPLTGTRARIRLMKKDKQGLHAAAA